MRRLLVQRLGQSVLVLWLVSVGSFALVRYAPGDPVAAMLGDEARTLPPAEAARIRHDLGLDDPWPAQYARWLARAVRGDLGDSLTAHRPVTALIAERVPASLALMGAALLVTVTVGATLGALAAVRHRRVVDRAITAVALLGGSMPVVWIALLLIFVFALRLRWFPTSGMVTLGARGGGLADRLAHLALPTATLALANLAVWTRYQRASLLEALRRDHVRTARAKGLQEWTVVRRHAWRNALVPMATLLGSSVAQLVSGAYLTETVFAWPGLGRLGVEAIARRDYPLVVGVAVLSSAAILLGNLLADLSYGWLDPRMAGR